LRVCGGLFSNSYLSMAVEDHERGRQFLRFRRTFAPTGLALFSGAVGAAVLLLGWAQESSPTALTAIAFLLWVSWRIASDRRVARSQIDAALVALIEQQGRAPIPVKAPSEGIPTPLAIQPG
jgi:hypothetical protein